MRWIIIAGTFAMGLFFMSYAACGKGNSVDSISADTTNTNDTTTRTMKIKIGSVVFQASLLNNASARAFQSLLPLTLNMTELNGNEKYFDLSTNLPINASNPGNIRSGDLMLWGNKTLVLFYKSFSTSYSYTKLGVIDDPKGLAGAVGSGNVTITFELNR
jgi:hypothetical protein